jgi:hypothetical protein
MGRGNRLELTKEILHKRYSRFSNEALLAAKAAGPGPYSPLAWEVIQELVAARGLAERAAEPEKAPVQAPPPPAPPKAPTASGASQSAPAPPGAPPSPAQPPSAEGEAVEEISPYFIASRLQDQRWSADAELPLTARYVLGVAALIFGLAGGALVVLAFVHQGGAAAFDPGALKLAAASALSLAFYDSSRRPPSAKHWWFAMLYSGASAPLALGQFSTATTAPGPMILLEVIVGLLWLLYFARRRGAYRLKPWPWLN